MEEKMGVQLEYNEYVQSREELGKVLPLKMPMNIQFSVTNLCNFKCFYCSCCESPEKRKSQGVLLKHMDYEDYKLCIDNIANYTGGGTIRRRDYLW